jgi:hypothetical protein
MIHFKALDLQTGILCFKVREEWFDVLAMDTAVPIEEQCFDRRGCTRTGGGSGGFCGRDCRYEREQEEENKDNSPKV